jgi:hypothetical protein
MALKASDLEVLRIVIGLSGIEVDHFGLWHDKAANAVATPDAGLIDPVTGLTFPDLNAPPTELTQTNLILPRTLRLPQRRETAPLFRHPSFSYRERRGGCDYQIVYIRSTLRRPIHCIL